MIVPRIFAISVSIAKTILPLEQSDWLLQKYDIGSAIMGKIRPFPIKGSIEYQRIKSDFTALFYRFAKLRGAAYFVGGKNMLLPIWLSSTSRIFAITIFSEKKVFGIIAVSLRPISASSNHFAKILNLIPLILLKSGLFRKKLWWFCQNKALFHHFPAKAKLNFGKILVVLPNMLDDDCCNESLHKHLYKLVFSGDCRPENGHEARKSRILSQSRKTRLITFFVVSFFLPMNKINCDKNCRWMI